MENFTRDQEDLLFAAERARLIINEIDGVLAKLHTTGQTDLFNTLTRSRRGLLDIQMISKRLEKESVVTPEEIARMIDT
jgi:hypothetical protein